MIRAGVFVAVVAALAVSGCSKVGGDKDTLAVVGSEKVTQAQLDAELKAGEVPRATEADVRNAALDQIVTRKLLAQAARAEKLDATPEGRFTKAAAMESYEAGLELRAIRDKVAAPTAAEAEAFVQAHPEMFARRSGYLIDQLHIKTQNDPALFQALQPTKTLADVERLLQSRGIPFRRSVEQMDTLRADPRLSTAIGKLGPGEPFVLNEPGGFTVSAVRQTTVQPVVGPAATAIAKEMLLAQRRGKATQDRVAALRAEKIKPPKAAKTK